MTQNNNQYKEKDMRGYLYVNVNKSKPTQPDYTGKVLIDNKPYKISAWDYKSSNGNNYLSLAISPYVEKDKNDSNESNVNNKDKETMDELDDLLRITDNHDNNEQNDSPF